MFAFRYPAVLILAFVLAGTLLGRWFDPGLILLWSLLTVAAGVLVLAAIRWPRRFFVLPLAVVSLVGAGLVSVVKYQSFPADDIGCFVDSGDRLRFFAEIEKWPLLKRNKTTLTCRVDSVALDGQVISSSGMILVTIRKETTRFALGDQVSFEGRLTSAGTGPYPQRFDYARYLHHKGIRGTVYINDAARVSIPVSRANIFGRAVNDIRSQILKCFHDNLTEIPAALASGFLIGETRNIPEDIYLAFRRTGTLHLLAVSGSNVILVLIVMIFLLRAFPMRPWIRLLILLGVIVVFCHLSYNQPSVVRASIMASMVLTARVVFRRAELNNIVAATAAILILYDPGNLFDIGFQLSFAVTWALILFLPYLNRLFLKSSMSRPVRYILLIVFSSLIASMIAAPITSYYFGEVSLVTIVSNLLIVPLVSMAVIGIVVLLVVYLILPMLAIIPGVLLDRLLQLVHYLVGRFDNLPVVTVNIPPYPALVAIALLLLIVGLFLAIRFIPVRRALVFVLLLAAGGRLLIDLRPAHEMNLVEIYNGGNSQAFVINRGGGVVVYRQRTEWGFDDFSSKLMPYLKNRDRPMPQYFIFMEPRYSTERRLDIFSGIDQSFELRPADGSRKLPGFSIWRNARLPDGSAPDSSFSILQSPGLLVIDIGEAKRLIFSEFFELPAELSAEDTYSFFFASDDTELSAALQNGSSGQCRVLLERPVRTYKLLDNRKMLADTSSLSAVLVEKGRAGIVSSSSF